MAISQYGNEYYGLSGDVKPLGTPLNGRKYTEMDTSKEYRFDAENQQWLEQSGGGGGGSSTLSGLTDVDISNPTDGQTLVYNASAGKWENGGGSGGAMVVPFEFVDEKPTLMAKAGDIYDAMARGIHVVVVFSVSGVGAVQAQPLYCAAIDSQSMDKLFVLSGPGATISLTTNIPFGVYTAETDDDYPTLNGGA